MKKDEIGQIGAKDLGTGAFHTGKGHAPKDQKDPKKQNPNLGDQGPHGGGEGLTGMQPGAGHPRGR